MLQGIFPTKWKQSIITPLLKKVNLPLQLSNYRPVSGLSFASKLIEKAALKQIMPYLERSNLYAKYNSAYRKFHSTETLLLKINSDILNNMDRQRVTIVVLLDLSAAFDTVDHNKLQDTLKYRFKITGPALDWFMSYLSNRTFRVKVKDCLSENFDLPHGVPQGSCMGPVAFLIYISCLYDISDAHSMSLHGYADDNQLVLSFVPNIENQKTSFLTMESCINEIRSFFLLNDLKINDSKTEIIIFGTKQQLNKLNNIDLHIGNSNIKISSSVCNLGIVMDKNLTMLNQISNTCKKSFFQLRKIRQLRKYLDENTTHSLTHALISSTIDYCNSLYYNLPNAQLKKLQTVQNTAARTISYTPKFSHITPVLKQLHWLPVKYRIIYKIALLTYKTLHNMSPAYLRNMLIEYSPTRTLRSANENLLVIPRINTNLGSRSFSYAAPSIWQSLPRELRGVPGDRLSTFKRLLKFHLFNIAYNPQK